MSAREPFWQNHVSFGNLLALIGGLLGAAGFAWALKGDIQVQGQRINALEEARTADERQRERDDARLDASLREIKDSIRRVEDKIDRAAEPNR